MNKHSVKIIFVTYKHIPGEKNNKKNESEKEYKTFNFK